MPLWVVLVTLGVVKLVVASLMLLAAVSLRLGDDGGGR